MAISKALSYPTTSPTGASTSFTALAPTTTRIATATAPTATSTTASAGDTTVLTTFTRLAAEGAADHRPLVDQTRPGIALALWGYNIATAVCRGSSGDGPGQRATREKLGPAYKYGPGGVQGSIEAQAGYDSGQQVQWKLAKADAAGVSLTAAAPTAPIAAAAPLLPPIVVAPLGSPIATPSFTAPAAKQPAAAPAPVVAPIVYPEPPPLVPTYQEYVPQTSYPTYSSGATAPVATVTPKLPALPPLPIAPISNPGAPASTSTALARPTVSVSLWTRILRFLGLAKAPADSTIHGEKPNLPMTQAEGAASLIRRARVGDQNAMAMLDCIGKNARAGDARAKVSFDLAKAYAEAHPIGSAISGEDEHPSNYEIESDDFDPVYTAAVKLSQGPKLVNSRIGSFASQFGAEDTGAFWTSYKYGVPTDDRLAARLGATFGVARRLQMVRHDARNVVSFDSRIAAEIGG